MFLSPVNELCSNNLNRVRNVSIKSKFNKLNQQEDTSRWSGKHRRTATQSNKFKSNVEQSEQSVECGRTITESDQYARKHDRSKLNGTIRSDE